MMHKYVNGECVEMSPEEIAAMERDIRAQMLHDRNRPLDLPEVLGLALQGIINTAQVDDNTALRMMGHYPQWAAGADYGVGYKVQFDSKLWKCRQAHSAITGWEPPNVASLWEQVCESHTGTEDDPIPYEGNMALVTGLYYVQDGAWYRCIRDTGNPVYHALRELVGHYVEVI
jgi:hypothetical protein